MKNSGTNSAIRLCLIAMLVFAFTALSLTGCSSPTGGGGGDGKDIVGIEVTGIKPGYNYGEALDFTAVKVVVKYRDGTSQTYATGKTQEQLTEAGVSVSAHKPNNVGTQTITVSYKGFSKTFTVTVYPPASTGDPGTGWYDAGEPYKISNADELAGLAELVNSGEEDFAGKTITLTANLNLEAYGVAAGYNDGKGWIPIGISSTVQFKGSFDGGGHTIIGLSINTSDNNQGLFGSYSGSFSYMIKNLVLKDVDIHGGRYVGGVAGDNAGYIQNCSVSGTVSATNGSAGGVAGQNRRTVQNCYATAAVSSSAGDNVGGVVGYSNMEVQNCYATGAVTGAGDNVGGVVGFNYHIVKNCYATGAVSSAGNNVGGVVGWNRDTVASCAALNSSVTGTPATIGRVIGYNDATGVSIDKIYAFRGMEVNGKYVVGNPTDYKNGSDRSAADITKFSFFFDPSAINFSYYSEYSVTGLWKWGADIDPSYKLPILWWQTSAPGMPGHIKDLTLTLASGSNGAADFGAIKDLAWGQKYIVNEGNNWYSVDGLGQLVIRMTPTEAVANSAELGYGVTTIKGSGGVYLDMDNSKTWNVWRVLGSETTSFSCTAADRNTYITESMYIDGTVGDGVTINVVPGKIITVPKDTTQKTLTLNGNAKIILERYTLSAYAKLVLEGGIIGKVSRELPGQLMFAGAAAAAPECTYNGTSNVNGAPGEAADVVRFPAGSDITGLSTAPRKVKALIAGTGLTSVAHLTIVASNPYEATISRDTLFAIAE